MPEQLEVLQAWLWSGILLAGAATLSVVAHRTIFSVALPRLNGRNAVVNLFLHQAKRPARIIFPLLALLVVLPLVTLPDGLDTVVKHIVDLGLLGTIGWLLIGFTSVVAELTVQRYERTGEDEFSLRATRTRIHVLQRVAAILIGVITAALMLMTFPSIQHLGVSLLASAGFAGLAVGMAARPALANLIAGLQIAFTQPIRLNDVVIVEGEWGWIEEIGSTYVVVRIWDLRRLVVPLSAFIEQPFQNWTRRSSELLATVYFYADYTVPVDELRQELRRILQGTDLWDGKVCVLQVTDAKEHVIELRALMSARDSSTAWDLRCHVREKLIAFLRERYPECLPRMRTELADLPRLLPPGQQVRVSR